MKFIKSWSLILGFIALLVIAGAIGHNAGVKSTTEKYKNALQEYESRLALVESKLTPKTVSIERK